MLQQDSLQTVEPAVEETPSVARQSQRPQHPYQVLRSLPKDATPAQQDSAIQATFQPKEIRYSSRPDTLHLPGHDVGKSIKDVSLPKYYMENFFSTDTLLHPELNGGRYGVAGDPIPYTLRGDSTISIILLLSFIIGVVSFSRSQRFIFRQAKRFFYLPRTEYSTDSETSGEVRVQLFLVIQTGLLFALLQYFFTQQYIGTTFVLSSQYQLIAIYMGLNVGYYLVRTLLYHSVNTVFFSLRQSNYWLRSLVFLTGMEGIAFLPVVLLKVYFNIDMQSVLICVAVILFFVKILTLYKAYVIFFRRNVAPLQIILYFCTLEIVPLIALGGSMVLIGNNLKISY